MTVLGLILGVFQSAVLPEPERWRFCAAFVAAGVLVGVYEKYRARFAVAQGIFKCLLHFWWLAAMTSGSAAALAMMAGLPGLVSLAFLAGFAYLVLLAVIAWWRAEKDWRKAARDGTWESRIEAFASLSTRKLAFDRTPLPAPQRTISLWLALGINLPLLVTTFWGASGEFWLFASVVLLLTCISGWLVLGFMGHMALYLNLRRYERQHGFRFESDQREALAQVRSTFRLRNWLCRPEDRVAPAPVKRQGRRPRGPR